MQDSNGKRFGALVTTIPLLILTIVMLGAPSAYALMPFHGVLRNNHASFAPAFLATPSPDTSLLPYYGLRVIYHPGSTPALNLYQEGDNSNSHVTNAVSFVGFKHTSKTVNLSCNKESGNNNNNYRYSENNNHHGLDVQDKSFISGIKITDVDRSNPHLLKVTLERTHNDNGNIPKYISVVAVGKHDQTVAGSTTLNGDDIKDSLTVDVLLKNKNNKNGHLDSSSDVTVWVVPATMWNRR
jgi:hypothetical protein